MGKRMRVCSWDGGRHTRALAWVAIRGRLQESVFTFHLVEVGSFFWVCCTAYSRLASLGASRIFSSLPLPSPYLGVGVPTLKILTPRWAPMITQLSTRVLGVGHQSWMTSAFFLTHYENAPTMENFKRNQHRSEVPGAYHIAQWAINVPNPPILAPSSTFLYY